MGCDIHSVIQIRKNGKWKSIGIGFDDRNYHAFSILANVRNGTGFAGVKTGSRIEPISEPRGLPKDFNVDTKYGKCHPDIDCEYSDDGMWLGDHSFSHLSLQEMLDYDFNQKRVGIGVLDEKTYRKWDKKESPYPRCGSVWGRDIITYSQKEYDLLESENRLPKSKKIYIQVEWTETLKESSGLFDYIQNDLVPLGKEYGNENVRMVFGFDS